MQTDFERIYRTWKDTDKFHKWIDDMKLVLKANCFAGEKIQKDMIPAAYVKKYGIHNLYRYAHPEGYRSCYTCLNNGKGYVVIVLDLMTHKEYERVFGY